MHAVVDSLGECGFEVGTELALDISNAVVSWVSTQNSSIASNVQELLTDLFVNDFGFTHCDSEAPVLFHLGLLLLQTSPFLSGTLRARAVSLLLLFAFHRFVLTNCVNKSSVRRNFGLGAVRLVMTTCFLGKEVIAVLLADFLLSKRLLFRKRRLRHTTSLFEGLNGGDHLALRRRRIPIRHRRRRFRAQRRESGRFPRNMLPLILRKIRRSDGLEFALCRTGPRVGRRSLTVEAGVKVAFDKLNLRIRCHVVSCSITRVRARKTATGGLALVSAGHQGAVTVVVAIRTATTERLLGSGAVGIGRKIKLHGGDNSEKTLIRREKLVETEL